MNRNELKQTATTIINQFLAGSRWFMAMDVRKAIVLTEGGGGAMFALRNVRSRKVRIEYDHGSDTYNVRYIKIKRNYQGFEDLKTANGMHAEDLGPTIERWIADEKDGFLSW